MRHKVLENAWWLDVVVMAVYQSALKLHSVMHRAKRRWMSLR